MQEYRFLHEDSENTVGQKYQSNINNLLAHDAEEYIKEEIKKAFDYQNKANKLFKKNNYHLALEEYKKVKLEGLY